MDPVFACIIYLRAENIPAANQLEGGEDQATISELDLLSLDIDIMKTSEQMVMQEHIRLLPIDLQVNYWLQLIKEYRVFKPSLLLSEWLAVQMIKVRDTVKITR